MKIRQLIQLDTPNKKGGTKRKHLLSAIKQYEKFGKNTDALTAELKPVELKPGTEYLFNIFSDLSRARHSDMNGPCPISYLELKSYCDLMDERLSPWEIEVIRLIDSAFIDEAAEQSKD